MFWSTRGTCYKKMNKIKSDIVPFLLCSKTFELMFEQQMKKIINKNKCNFSTLSLHANSTV